MYTEEQAKTKWCPHARFLGSGAGGAGNKFGRYSPADTECVCIASECMAWQWGNMKEIAKHQARFPELNFATAASQSGRGYCGLAGKP
jgi:hypothetical protein